MASKLDRGVLSEEKEDRGYDYATAPRPMPGSTQKMGPLVPSGGTDIGEPLPSARGQAVRNWKEGLSAITSAPNQEAKESQAKKLGEDLASGALPVPPNYAQFKTDIENLGKTLKENKKLLGERRFKVGLAKAFAKLGAGLYGLHTGLDLGGVKFDPIDWKEQFNETLGDYKARRDAILARMESEQDTYDTQMDRISAIEKRKQRADELADRKAERQLRYDEIDALAGRRIEESAAKHEDIQEGKRKAAETKDKKYTISKVEDMTRFAQGILKGKTSERAANTAALTSTFKAYMDQRPELSSAMVALLPEGGLVDEATWNDMDVDAQIDYLQDLGEDPGILDRARSAGQAAMSAAGLGDITEDMAKIDYKDVAVPIARKATQILPQIELIREVHGQMLQNRKENKDNLVEGIPPEKLMIYRKLLRRE